MPLPPEILARARAEAEKAPDFTDRQIARLTVLFRQADPPADEARAS